MRPMAQPPVTAFIFSGVFVGVAGAVYASWVHYIEPPDVFDVLYSVKAIVMVLLGGVLREQFGSYDASWYLSIFFGVASAIITLPIVEKPAPKRIVAAPA